MSSTKLSGLDSSSAGIVLSCTQMLQQAKKCQSWVDRKSEHVKFPLFPMRQSYLLAGPNRGKGVGDLYNMYLRSLYRYTGILWLKNVSLKWDLMTKEFICIIKHKDAASASESTWKFLPEMKVAASWGNGQVKGHYCPAIAWFFPHHLYLVTLKAGYRVGLTISWAWYIYYHIPYSVIHVSNIWGPIL